MRWNTSLFLRLPVPAIGLLLAILLFTFPLDAAAQQAKDWNKTGDVLEGAVGLHYGKLGGNGLSFRLPLRWYLYLQIGGGIWHAEDDQKHNLGAQLDYILRQDAHLRLYLAAGLGYFYHREMVTGVSGSKGWEKDEDWNSGAGVGIEYLLGQRVALQGELDFVRESGSGNVKIAPQVGLHYYW